MPSVTSELSKLTKRQMSEIKYFHPAGNCHKKRVVETPVIFINYASTFSNTPCE